MRMTTATVLTVATLALAVRLAASCACEMPDSVLVGYDTETGPLMKARALRELDVQDPNYKWFIFEYNFVFRGCVPSAYEIAVKTPRTKEGCGIDFEIGTRYLLSLQLAGGATPLPYVSAQGVDQYSAVLCNFNRKWEEVPYEDANVMYYSEHRGCA